MSLDIIAGVEPVPKKRVLFVGPRGVGKTSLLERYMYNSFRHNLEWTTDVVVHDYDNYTFYDTPGDMFLPIYMLGNQVDVIVIVVRRDMPTTIKCVKGAVENIGMNYPNIRVIVCCVASDLPSTVSDNYVLHYTSNANYIEVSCKNGDNIESLVTQLSMS